VGRSAAFFKKRHTPARLPFKEGRQLSAKGGERTSATRSICTPEGPEARLMRDKPMQTFANDRWQRVFKEVGRNTTDVRLPPSLYRHAGEEIVRDQASSKIIVKCNFWRHY